MNPEQYKKDQVRQIAKENGRNCKTCRYYNTYFDCSQCYDFDEWENINQINVEITR